MKHHRTPFAVFTLLLVLLLPGGADEALVAARLGKIPAAAAESLRKAAGDGTIERVSLEKDGRITVYEAAIVQPGRPNREVSVTADGQLNAGEETVPLEVKWSSSRCRFSPRGSPPSILR